MTVLEAYEEIEDRIAEVDRRSREAEREFALCRVERGILMRQRERLEAELDRATEPD